MIKRSLCLVALVLLLSASRVSASPVTVNDTLPGSLTYAISYNGASPRGGSLSTGDYLDVIGSDIYRTDYARVSYDPLASTLTLMFHTNFPAGGIVVERQTVRPADIFLSTDNNPDWNFGIVTSAHNGYSVGNVVANPSFQTSQDIWQSKTGYYYAGRYTTADPGNLPSGEVIPVRIGGGESTGNATTFGWVNSAGLNYDLTVVLGLETLGYPETLAFLWGTADCGNDTIYGHLSFAPPGPPPHVPIPGTVLLMGTGLMGLGLLGWRRRRS